MFIAIPSSGRPFRQTTWGNLPEPVQDFAAIVVPEYEAEIYRQANPEAQVLACPVKGIGPTRQWCVEKAPRKLLMLDDDLTFFSRRIDNPALFCLPDPIEITHLVSEIDDSLDDFAHVGVGTREGGNRLTERRYFNTRLLRALAFRTDVLMRENIRFDRLPVMEDFDVNLSLLRKGYRSLLLNHMVHDQHGSNLAGGCSQYRTPEVQAAGARGLAELHYGFVNVVEKTTKTAWGGQTRLDVRIQWKKAYESSTGPRSLDQ